MGNKNLQVDDRLLFTFDQSFIEDEPDRWVGAPVAEPPMDVTDPDVCACRKHPSGAIKPPNPHCMNCKGTGSPKTGEVYDTVFDGKGNFTQAQPAPESNAQDTATMVKFR